MAMMPVYVIDGARWVPLARAATMLATNIATIKTLMGGGQLDWCQRSPGSKTLFVREADLLRLRGERQTFKTEVKRRASS
ncbi:MULTISPECIES: hypothetical protein [unclassified Sphingobium]|uniref:hypothetical protein n=1 Tax=unclassified Sphingobium TaxID=2611147 RepID=UPI0035A6D157